MLDENRRLSVKKGVKVKTLIKMFAFVKGYHCFAAVRNAKEGFILLCCSFSVKKKE